MERFRAQAERQGTKLVTADVQKVDFSSPALENPLSA
jgi:hypothetical protein